MSSISKCHRTVVNQKAGLWSLFLFQEKGPLTEKKVNESIVDNTVMYVCINEP